MSASKPIPIPVSRKFNDFRFHGVPLLIFALSIFMIIHLWGHTGGPGMIQGRVIGDNADVRAPDHGEIEALFVTNHQNVSQGEVVALLRTLQPNQALAALKVLEAEVELARIAPNIGLIQEQQSQFFDWYELRQDLLRTRIETTTLQIRRDQAKRELDRADRLMDEGVLAIDTWERAMAQFKELDEALTATLELSEQLEGFVNQSKPGLPTESGPGEILQAHLRHQELRLEELRTRIAPLPLLAPVSGQVATPPKPVGSFVTQGDILLEIRSGEATHIEAYVRAPVVEIPEAGQLIEVSRRSEPGIHRTARILSVGSSVRPLPAPLQSPLRPTGDERGLPLLVSLPEDVRLLPGEAVDLRPLRKQPPDSSL
ncbi:MAG: hypothetical protein JJU29_15600 [Verrucomicrobia bacterium]|nr:hypothetical protein [Verrucomicrobiota bacterium]MCH8513391.1 HlyD family secretion protein [Kiritimatiellia bacterium]